MAKKNSQFKLRQKTATNQKAAKKSPFTFWQCQVLTAKTALIVWVSWTSAKSACAIAV
jgi:hypothetical protein